MSLPSLFIDPNWTLFIYLYFTVNIDRDSAQLKVITPELANSYFASSVSGQVDKKQPLNSKNTT